MAEGLPSSTRPPNSWPALFPTDCLRILYVFTGVDTCFDCLAQLNENNSRQSHHGTGTSSWPKRHYGIEHYTRACFHRTTAASSVYPAAWGGTGRAAPVPVAPLAFGGGGRKSGIYVYIAMSTPCFLDPWIIEPTTPTARTIQYRQQLTLCPMDAWYALPDMPNER